MTWLSDAGRKGGTLSGRVRRVCLVCGYTSTASALARHQRKTSHSGWTTQKETPDE